MSVFERVVGAGNQQIYLSDIMLQCDTTLGATNLMLPVIATLQAYKDRTGNNLQPVQFYFKNIGSGSNSITVTAGGTDTVNTLPAVTLTGAGVNGVITIDSDNSWVLTFSVANSTIGSYISTSNTPSNSNTAPFPSIGSAANFVMVGSAGITINTSPSLVATGNVAQLGSVTGNLTLIGGIDYTTASSQGSAALSGATALGATLNALVPTYTHTGAVANLEGLVIGSNPAGTFNAGTFYINGALGSGSSAIITLSGAGNFVFQVNGAISWGANTSFLLTNGANAANVFFVSTAGVTIAANCVIKGTYVTLSLSSAITVGDVCDINGRLFGSSITYTAATASETLYIPAY